MEINPNTQACAKRPPVSMKSHLPRRLAVALIGILSSIAASPWASLVRADDYGHTSRIGCSGYDFVVISSLRISIVTHGSPAKSAGHPCTALAVIESATNGQTYQMSRGLYTVRPGAYNHTTACGGSGVPIEQIYSEIHYN
jgi:hypothetical protein